MQLPRGLRETHSRVGQFIDAVRRNLLRFGLAMLATGMFVSGLFSSVPITTSFSAWYGGYALAALLAVLALAGYACHTSLGGQKLFAGKLLDE